MAMDGHFGRDGWPGAGYRWMWLAQDHPQELPGAPGAGRSGWPSGKDLYTHVNIYIYIPRPINYIDPNGSSHIYLHISG